ncbi:acetyl-CoA carboxylase biotin carboxyl carrier protein subunit [Pyrococcus abyssi]|uniref:MmdC methylmalonyl-coA decarboxylase gamma chain n=1 Tax=Pyrococcus abyssi (strain GE5 / Orsay) TaxID=272844 RepID=Q9V0A6_PYRAB|nr:acetyl-CoA carboxylase biotin carboxyl carrier protein subunit [Pyrococcus abyssi]CAB49799.1 mmdC methylmalonyl-coA decarboxylase gamma chain [Pyrococcus abyssi GE5]CCE70292.1 TPA: putative acetyl-CoA carboxylase biotin carboxyl carrier protein subunit [Pyrococcus abyssi GE5]
MKVKVVVNGKEYEVDVEEVMPGKFRVTLEGKTYEVEANLGIQVAPVQTQVATPAPTPTPTPTPVQAPTTPQVQASENVVTAPMPGKVLKILVQEGQQVKLGQGLLILEAMKMENEIPAPRDGVVKRILVKEGDAVDTGTPLIELG